MKRRKKKRKTLTTIQRRMKVQRRMRLGLILLLVLMVVTAGVKIFKPQWLPIGYCEIDNAQVDASKPDIDVELLTPNPYSRPGIKTGKIRGIVVHYTANPGATAISNRNYFEGLKDSHITKTSSNFIVGLDGEIIQCVPTWEVAYASNDRNKDTVSIECCHPDSTGEFNKATYRSVIQLCAWLCLKFNLSPETIIRHYDVTGKNCPKYYVEHPDEWKQFRKDVKKALENSK